MRVYIAGRVTGMAYETVKAKFDKAESILRFNGMNPVNPLKHVNQHAGPKDAMKICVPLLLECDALYLLDDWTFSEGAQIETQLARYAGIDLINEDDLKQN